MNVEPLLQTVDRKLAVLKDLENRFSHLLAPRFSIFDYLRDDEYGLSRCLRDLLDPQGTHGQGSLFLDAFLDMIDMSELQVESRRAQISLESATLQKRRIDLVAKFPTGLIGIENKPWAADQDAQLLHYAQFLAAEADRDNLNRPWKLVFLSNRGPTEGSTGGDMFKAYEDHFSAITYQEVERWLQDCAMKSNALSVRVFVEQLAKYVRTHVNGELDMTAEKEVRDSVLQSAESVRSAHAIHSTWPSIRTELLESFRKRMDQQVSNLIDEVSIRIEWNDGLVKGIANHGFNVLFQDGQKKMLRFTFDGPRHNGFFWGIFGRQGDDDAARSEAIRQTMEDVFGVTSDNIWWHWWTYAGDTEDLGPEFRDWDARPEPWVAIYEHRLADQILEIIKKVQEAFKNKMDLLKGTGS